METDDNAIVNTRIGPGSFTPPPKTVPPPAPAPAPTPAPIVEKPNPGIVSSTDARNVLDKGGADLDQMSTQVDPYLEYLNKQATAFQQGTATENEGAEKKEIGNITAESSRMQTKIQNDYARYKAGLETLGIQSGLSQMAPDLQAGRLLQAANDETTKIAEIQQKEDFAIARAKQARLDKDAASLKGVLSEIREIKKEKAQALKDQLDRRSRDITIAKSLATFAWKSLQDLPDEQKEAFILQTAKDNEISPAALIASLAEEEDAQRKFDLGIKLQEKSLARGEKPTVKPLSTAELNYLKKNNPMLDIGFGDTDDDVKAAMAAADQVTSGIKTAFNNPALVRNGRYTFDYIKNALANLPPGISRIGFLQTIGPDKLAVGSKKNRKEYGITEDEFEELEW